MEILKILQQQSSDLLPEDLELFRTELAVGDYPESYQRECLEYITKLEKWNAPKHTAAESGNPDLASVMQAAELSPDSAANALPFPERCRADLCTMRQSEKYRSSFRTYVQSHKEFDESFVDAHFGLFEEWEVGAIVSELALSEAFLEKYFSVLDKDKIARYQLFSEQFYQRHFSELDAEVVLKKGKNEWRKKENRSRQFDVFLRLKGVQY